MSFDHKTCFDQKLKLIPFFLSKILLTEKRAEPGQIKSALLKKKKKRSKLYFKDNMGQTVLPLTQISWKYLKEKKIGRFVRVLKGQYGTKHSVLDSCFKNNWSLEKANNGQTVLWLIQFFNKFLTPKMYYLY